MAEINDQKLSEILNSNGYVLARNYGPGNENIDECKEFGFGYSSSDDGSGIYGNFVVIPEDNKAGFVTQIKYAFSGNQVRKRFFNRSEWSEWITL